jgi:dienelactone hydrolase
LAQDVSRSIDYLETRPDLRTDTLAYYGFSWGTLHAPMILAVEGRLKSSVLVIGGFPNSRYLPEIDPINFAPRVKQPTLMLNGRYDFTYPLETSQRPMFRALGTDREHKRHVLYDVGHGLMPFQSQAEVEAWLDRYQGKVK